MEQEYKLSVWAKIFNSILGLLCIIFTLFLLYIPDLFKWNITNSLILIALLLTFISGVLIVINQFKARIIVGFDSIKRVRVFGSKEIMFSDVKGIRSGSRYFVIESESGKRMVVNNPSDYTDSEQLEKWVKEKFSDCDAADLKVDKAAILNDENLGANESERENKIRRMKAISITYNIVGGVITFVAIPFSNTGISLLLLLYPILGIAIMKFSKGLIKFVSNSSRSARLWLMLGFVLPIFMMLVKSLGDYEIVNYGHIWLPFIGFGLLMATVLFFTGINKSIPAKGQVIFMIIAGLMYGYGSTLEINCAFDQSTPQLISTFVDSKWIEQSKGTHYHLKLVSWDLDKKPKDIEVSNSTYEQYEAGNSIKVNLKAGVLNIPWFFIKL